MKRACLLVSLLIAAGCSSGPTVGSKAFTESAILGELVTQLSQNDRVKVDHRMQLGGTGLVWNALLAGDIDVYPDYTGTIIKDILKDPTLDDDEAIRAALVERGVLMSQPLGFENSYEIGMKEELADRLGVRKISDLRVHPEIVFGFSNEFVKREEDGWPALRRAYGLPQTRAVGMEHAVSYRALDDGSVQAIEVYATDANIKVYDVRILEDDLDFFPEYQAVLLYRTDLAERAAEIVVAIKKLEGQISHDEMFLLNFRVDKEHDTPIRAANDFITKKFGLELEVYEPNLWERLLTNTWRHLILVVVSLSAAIVVAIPLGVLAAKRPATEHVILSTAEIIQTVPALALLILLMKMLELVKIQTIGPVPAIVALFMYSLLPVIRNTFTGLRDMPNSLRESATALGLTPSAQLWQIELPMASRMILAGIKTTAVINVGYATLGGFIGAGGYGEPIFQGLTTNNLAVMLEGAIPAAALALLVKWGFELTEQFVVPKGLRIKAAE